MRLAIVGAGWAGMAAAMAAVQRGHNVTVFEAARTVGGRARTVPCSQADGSALLLDNGQHILIGAYSESLRLMHECGVDVEEALLRLPLTLRFADGSGLQWPDLPPPWDALFGILRARSWSWRERLALLRTASTWQRKRFVCAAEASVNDLCQGLPPRLVTEFIDPLCVAALNTRAHEASGQVFLRVLKDSLFSGPGGSNLLLPRAELGALFPEAAARWLRTRGAIVRTGTRIHDLAAPLAGAGWHVNGMLFDGVVLATASTEAARLVSRCAQNAPIDLTVPLCDWAACAHALRFEAITTVYAQTSAGADGHVLPVPMLALRSGPDRPAQFVFDRGQLGGPAGLLAFVVSTSQGERELLEQQVLAQAQGELELADLRLVQTVVEKRATFACTPALERPATRVVPGLWACGDYVAGPYPATLEGAVRSGTLAGTAACDQGSD
ncbi:MAG: FAD-dependent oxidoreductase [Simplicispira suum]|uniref:hydroxysqualene dehydroxylase HpnE n=1 Tax=Simplicispira suum TaxID=2109915 RepID=UPI001C6D23F6|nr:hydroxysqualene dehydroxylase HpnE [Simplicispira suum]MBW7834783.1 FAD-dependent oxidoreductase [Simplicispira suum]